MTLKPDAPAGEASRSPRKRGPYKRCQRLDLPRGSVRVAVEGAVVYVQDWRSAIRWRREVARRRAVEELASAAKGLAEGLNRIVDALSPDKPRPPKGAA
jgi:hypothetical protein